MSRWKMGRDQSVPLLDDMELDFSSSSSKRSQLALHATSDSHKSSQNKSKRRKSEEKAGSRRGSRAVVEPIKDDEREATDNGASASDGGGTASPSSVSSVSSEHLSLRCGCVFVPSLKILATRVCFYTIVLTFFPLQPRTRCYAR